MSRNISYLIEAIHISTCPLLSRGCQSRESDIPRSEVRLLQTWSHFENILKMTEHVKEIISSCRKQKWFWSGQVMFGSWLGSHTQVHQSHLQLRHISSMLFYLMLNASPAKSSWKWNKTMSTERKAFTAALLFAILMKKITFNFECATTVVAYKLFLLAAFMTTFFCLTTPYFPSSLPAEASILDLELNSQLKNAQCLRLARWMSKFGDLSDPTTKRGCSLIAAPLLTLTASQRLKSRGLKRLHSFNLKLLS